MIRQGIECDALGDFYAIIPIEVAESVISYDIVSIINYRKSSIFKDIPYGAKVIDVLFYKEKYHDKGVYIVKSGLYFNNGTQRIQPADDEEFGMMVQFLISGDNHYPSLELAENSIGIINNIE